MKYLDGIIKVCLMSMPKTQIIYKVIGSRPGVFSDVGLLFIVWSFVSKLHIHTADGCISQYFQLLTPKPLFMHTVTKTTQNPSLQHDLKKI